MLRFTATECGSKVEYGTMICGASNSRAPTGPWHTFILMRRYRTLADDEGPYFELDEQAQGFHNGIRSVAFDSNVVTFALAPPRGQGIGHRQITVTLACKPAEIRQFKRGIATVFRDQPWRVRGG